MEGAAFRLKSQRTCTRINQHQPPDLTLTKSERATAWGMEGEWMLMALKTPMGIVCCCIHLHCHWPPLSLSRSGCLSFPKPLWADHPLLLQLLTALTILFSLTLSFFYIPLLIFFIPLSPIALTISLFLALSFPQFPCPVIFLLHLALFSRVQPPLPSFPLLSYSLVEEDDKMWAKFTNS